jgi:hypothetical protein
VSPDVPRRAPHVVCFAPYTDWSIHSARQVTILQALRQRGCTVTYVTCDGAFSDCDLLQASSGAPSQKPAHACLFCQARVSARLAGWSMPFRWLGQWLTTEDRRNAGRWVQSLKAQDYATAQYGDWPVGAWVKSSVHRHFRHNVLDTADPAVAATFGSYLYSGLLACFGLDRLFEEEAPNAQLLFNGSMGPTRVALELAKRRGIRTICEERGYMPGRIQLYDNVNCFDFSGIEKLWADWKDVPLLAEEIDEVGKILADRWHGHTRDITVFSRGMGAAEHLRRDLGLDARPFAVLYTSSMDESVERDRGGEIFADQNDWIDATLAFFAQRADLQLVIRVHPNIGSQKSLGRNMQDEQYFAALKGRLPANVKMVPADSPISSYDLAAVAAFGLVWFSTIGLEMAALGRPVARVGAGPLLRADFLHPPRDPEDYARILGRLAEPGFVLAAATLIKAWRFAYIYFLRQSLAFPLVRQPNWFVGEMAYDSAQVLAPGGDASLDRICAMFMEARPVHGPAPARAVELAPREEAAIMTRLAPYRDMTAASAGS